MSTSGMFTPLANVMLNTAAIEAMQRQNSIEPEHVLFALLQKPQKSSAGKALIALRVDLRRLRKSLSASMPVNGLALEGIGLPTERCKIVLAYAENAAKEAQHTQVATVDLLVGLLLEGGPAAQVLLTASVNKDLIEIAAQSRFTFTPAEPLTSRSREEVKNVRAQGCVFWLFQLSVSIIVGGASGFIERSGGLLHVLSLLNTWLVAFPLFAFQPITGWYPFVILAYVASLYALFIGFFGIFSLVFYLAGPKTGISRNSKYVVRFFALHALLIVFYLEVGTFFYVVQPQSWWLWMTGVYMLVSMWRAYIAPFWLFPFLHKVTPITDEVLLQRLDKLLQRTQTKLHGFYRLESLSAKETEDSRMPANAALIGLGNSRSIVMTETLMRDFSLDEIEVILAHELGHDAYYDLWKMLLYKSLSILILLGMAQWFFFTILYNGSFLFSDQGALGLLLLFCIFVIILFGMIYLYMWRRRVMERLADEYALQLIQQPAIFKNAMMHLTRANKQPPAWTSSQQSLLSHPSLLDRLRHADDFVRRMAHQSKTA